MEARAASPDELTAATALLLLLRTSPSTFSCSDELSSIRSASAEEELSCISDSSSPSTHQIMQAADPLAALTRSIKPKDQKSRSMNVHSSKLSSVRRRAAAIVAFLSSGTASEFRIREAVGNSPDTSKALRMLLRMGGVTRSGAGGQKDPFTYTVTMSQSEISCEPTYF